MSIEALAIRLTLIFVPGKVLFLTGCNTTGSVVHDGIHICTPGAPQGDVSSRIVEEPGCPHTSREQREALFRGMPSMAQEDEKEILMSV